MTFKACYNTIINNSHIQVLVVSKLRSQYEKCLCNINIVSVLIWVMFMKPVEIETLIRCSVELVRQSFVIHELVLRFVWIHITNKLQSVKVNTTYFFMFFFVIIAMLKLSYISILYSTGLLTSMRNWITLIRCVLIKMRLSFYDGYDYVSQVYDLYEFICLSY